MRLRYAPTVLTTMILTALNVNTAHAEVIDLVITIDGDQQVTPVDT